MPATKVFVTGHARGETSNSNAGIMDQTRSRPDIHGRITAILCKQVQVQVSDGIMIICNVSMSRVINDSMGQPFDLAHWDISEL